MYKIGLEMALKLFHTHTTNTCQPRNAKFQVPSTYPPQTSVLIAHKVSGS